jgi:molybdopterin-containing oxidoreductase family iron-sulfur binding subunit
MSSEQKDLELPEHADSDPGAEVAVRQREDGGVTVSFSDGSDDLEVSRREFLRISGVAAASATMTGANCRYPQEEVVPYLDRPEQSNPGEISEYATVCNGCSAQCGLVVKTRSGRPIKLEGNEHHPVNEGSTCARGESSYRRLYDPDRAEGPLRVRSDGDHVELEDWDDLDRTVVNKLQELGTGGTIRILTRNRSGSARDQLLEDISDAHPDTEHYVWEPLTAEALLQASDRSYGSRHVPTYHLERADLIVSLGSDFLGTWMSPTEFTRKFVQKREIDDEHPENTELNRFIAFEGALTTTGQNADEHHAVPTSSLAEVAMGLAHVILNEEEYGPLSGNGEVLDAVADFDPETVAAAVGIEPDTIRSNGQELVEHAGNGLVLAGSASSNAPNGVALESAVNLLNAALGNEGNTVERSRTSRQDEGNFGDLANLADEMRRGEVDLLIIDDANPVYAAPPELDFEQAIEEVGLVVSTSDRVDETPLEADYLAAGSHYLESWGDSNPREGVHAIQQPTIQPLYDTRSFEESLLTWFGDSGLVTSFGQYLDAPPTPDDQQQPDEPQIKSRGLNVPTDAGAWYRYLRNHWRNELYPKTGKAIAFEQFWEDILRRGVWEEDRPERAEPEFRVGATLQQLPADAPEARTRETGNLESMELHAAATVGLYDGRTANNGHLQEMPDPVTKSTWGTWAALSPRDFAAAGIEEGDVLEITVSEGGIETTLRFPAIMQPGMADGVVAVPLGYGREQAGVVGNDGNDVARNAFELSRSRGGVHAYAGLDATVEETSDTEEVAIVQGSQVIDLDERPLLATTTQEHYREDPHAGVGAHEPEEGLWDAHDYGESSKGGENRGPMALKWGMSIDMTKCTGCSACVTACQEENNVPVVGRQGVLEGREMHWMRIDRYFLLPTSGQNEAFDEIRHDIDDDPMMGENPANEYARQMYDETGEVPDSIADPQAANQPMLCQHCERAPCETVCPVAATTHSSDGLNQMAYNRCVGTRYCSNNCPYKVRRFNWFNYSRDRGDGIMSRITPELEEHGRLNVEEPLPMGLNPDVTVRSRGVMEKCTFCVQRIRRAKWQLKEENRDSFEEDDVVTACEKACPADAIEFGNIHEDSDHQVRRDHESARTTRALAHLNTAPSVAYLTDVRNTDGLPGGHGVPAHGGGDHGEEDGHGDESHSEDDSHGGDSTESESHGGESH